LEGEGNKCDQLCPVREDIRKKHFLINDMAERKRFLQIRHSFFKTAPHNLQARFCFFWGSRKECRIQDDRRGDMYVITNNYHLAGSDHNENTS